MHHRVLRTLFVFTCVDRHENTNLFPGVENEQKRIRCDACRAAMK